MKSKALYKAAWVSFSPFHRWEIRTQERFPTCWVHKSLWNLPLSISPAAPQTQKPCLHKDGFVFLCWHICYWRNGIYWVFLGDLHLFWAGKSVGLGAGTSGCARRTDGASILSAASHPAQLCVLQQGSSARQNTRVGRQLVPKLLEESSSWPLVCSEVGWIDCAAVETQGQGAGVEGHATGCCQRRRKREIFMFCGASFPTLEKGFILCVCVNAL